MGRILIGDSHPLCSAGLAALLGEFDEGGTSVAEDFASVLSELDREASTSLALLDFGLPGMGAIDGLRRLRTRYPAMHVVALCADLDRDQVLNALAAGLYGVIPKNLSGAEMRIALRTVHQGQIYVPARLCDGTGPKPARGRPTMSPGIEALTERQREVLDLVVLGQSNKEIARALGITEGTVKVHVTATFRQLGVRNRVSAASALQARGYSADREPYLPGMLREERRA